MGSETGFPEAFTPEDRKQAIREGFELRRSDRFAGYPTANFIFTFHEDLPAECGLPLIFVQGNLAGTAIHRRRMRERVALRARRDRRVRS